MAAAYLKAPGLTVVQFCRKIPYPNRSEAAKILRVMQKGVGPKAVGSGTLNAYRCKFCDSWHIGHR